MEIFLSVLILIAFITPFLIWTFLNFTGYKAQGGQLSKWKIIGISSLVALVVVVSLILILVATIS